MSAKTPIRATFTGSEVSGLAEYQSGEFIDLSHGGLGASLSIGTTGQVLKVNSGGTALEFGNVEAVINIDTANDLTGSTLVSSDQILLSDGGTEGRVTLSQLDTLFSGTTQTLTNKSGDISQWTNDVGYLTSFTETNDLTSSVTWANVPDANITESSVTQHEAALSITESQISDLQSYLTSETNDLTSAVTWANIPDANVPQSAVTQHEAALSITESQISDLQSYLTSETNDLTSSVTWANVPDANITESSVTQHEAALSIGNSQLTSGIDAAKISSGSVSNTEFDYLNGVTSNLQTQLDNKASTGFAIAMAIAL